MKGVASMLKSALAGMLLIAAGTALAADTDRPKDVSIPFADEGSIRNFDPVDSYTLYIEDVSGRWYKASLMGSCTDLPFATAIRFDVRGTHTLDRNSSVIVNGRSCPFESLVETTVPPGWKSPKPKG
jgi:hypothetical protein